MHCALEPGPALARAPGRGAWIGVSRGELETALAKGKLKGALARAFKGAALEIPADLPDKIEQIAFAQLTREQSILYQQVVDQLLRRCAGGRDDRERPPVGQVGDGVSPVGEQLLAVRERVHAIDGIRQRLRQRATSRMNCS